METPSDIVGHEKQCGELLTDIAHRNVTHAYLFLGPPHLGKFTVARWFAWRLLVDGLDPASHAAVREQIDRMIHPDFLSMDALWIEGVQEDWRVISQSSNIPQEQRTKKPAAKTDTISIEDVRSLHERLLATGDSSHLCCLIRSIERMQPAAANAFLKLLEEPPPRVVFVLTTANEHALLPTVVSRTRILRFHPLPTDKLKPLLDGQDDDEASFALHLAHGAPGTLVSLLQNPDLLRANKQLHAQAKQFWQAQTLHERLKWVMPYAERHADLPALLKHLGDTLREHPDPVRKAEWAVAYTQLAEALTTNAHRGLLLERFALAVSHYPC
jgi:DNA polymerase-3 subunit delta'